MTAGLRDRRTTVMGHRKTFDWRRRTWWTWRLILRSELSTILSVDWNISNVIHLNPEIVDAPHSDGLRYEIKFYFQFLSHPGDFSSSKWLPIKFNLTTRFRLHPMPSAAIYRIKSISKTPESSGSRYEHRWLTRASNFLHFFPPSTDRSKVGAICLKPGPHPRSITVPCN